MTPAAFKLQKYIFDKVNIDLENLKNDSQLSLDINPSGIYSAETGIFQLIFVFTAFQGDNRVISVRCVSEYKFQELTPYEELPRMFYANSIAILFPYVRAFVSTVTLQANIPPILLPTMNLTSLGEKLQAQTTIR